MRLGLDIGSTTIKYVVLGEHDEVIYKDYKRHYSHIKENVLEILNQLIEKGIISNKITFAISGSAGMGLANGCDITFVQEVYATRVAAKRLIPDTDCIIELGGEDAKILFLKDGMDVRMNGTCAGGTGAFIDQMATLLNVDVTNMNDLASQHEKLYSIASRCGVFAKTDVQPLLNQGASKADVAASIYKAVVNQTIGGLAQGRDIEGNVVYLGGPLTFMPELRKSFDESLNLTGICPENSLYFVSLGAAYCADKEYDADKLVETISNFKNNGTYGSLEPLFKSQEELDLFRARHSKAFVATKPLTKEDTEPLYLGIDSGSTTLKMVLIDKNEEIRWSSYEFNQGNPAQIIKNNLTRLYEEYPLINICGASSTGYGEDLARAAFHLDGSLVETMAHFKAAKHFMPDVDFIIDIGGQDIKCFKIEQGAISNIFLNEACSSGCGSFLQTFAKALGYKIEDFAQIGLLAPSPVDLGSRCTVFMNSQVKQAQKDGATIENISAGLSISVVKNALYKVIRATNVETLGRHIVVQGGTFNNEAVLRAFERELGLDVICPNISGLMGAYGAALHSKELKKDSSDILSLEALKNFTHTVRYAKCGLCKNGCALTINSFGDKSTYISGNRCERPLAKSNLHTNDDLNIYEYVRNKLSSYTPQQGKRGKIGIPLTLNMYELLPFWHTFFTKLGFEVISSGFSNRKIFTLGQHTIPSDTECYPAKLTHGHIESLINQGLETIFYPCMTYNINENKGDNHYNCPIVAYNPENIVNNVSKINNVNFIHDFLSLNNRVLLEVNLYNILNRYYKISKKEIKKACDQAYDEYKKYLDDIRQRGREIVHKCRMEGKEIVVLCGRPYHVDPEVNHGIDKLISGFGVGVVNEESISYLTDRFQTNVLNQWTYHARLYSAARYVITQDDMNLIQLVSFGCGLDAITTDETKDIIEHGGKIYTQIKIDEITNLGAVKIRLRSLFEALRLKKEEEKNDRQ
ncbi:MAG: acyl-CoA dehydratase activase [Acholeplasmatales bacterium]|nr:acyl-CoA dehydratase activase [Acholeplasmatales bacterium]